MFFRSVAPVGGWLSYRLIIRLRSSTMAYIFEWDPAKAAINLRKHGVAFDEAVESFGDPLSLNMADPDHSLGEQRLIVLGFSRRGRLLVVSYAERGERTRIITARLATRSECHRYEEDFR